MTMRRRLQIAAMIAAHGASIGLKNAIIFLGDELEWKINLASIERCRARDAEAKTVQIHAPTGKDVN